MEKNNMSEIAIQAENAKKKSFALAGTSLVERNLVLRLLAELLLKKKEEIYLKNREDMKRSEAEGLNPVMLKRLELTPDKIGQMAAGVLQVASLPDPLGHVQLRRELDDDLLLTRYSVPVGLIGVIFEARPEAFIQIASLCIKSGNCAILKGGKEAVLSNRILYETVLEASEAADRQLGRNIFEGTVVLAQTREEINTLLELDTVIDLMIPRGSNALVRFVKEHTKIPVLGHADGICHYYIDSSVDQEQAVSLVVDSKTQYPAVCNALETLLVHKDSAESFLPAVKKALDEKGVEIRGDEAVRKIIDVIPATEEDWATEYDDLILSVKVVSDIHEAMDHINRYGSHHTDAIATDDASMAEIFFAGVDSSSVMHNASTRFADGFRYGFGAEVGISTSKIHARGPVGLEGLTIYKYRLQGQGNLVRDYVSGEKKFTHKDI